VRSRLRWTCAIPGRRLLTRSRTAWILAGAAVLVASGAAAFLTSSGHAPAPPGNAARDERPAPAPHAASRATSRTDAQDRATPPRRERVDPPADDPHRVRAPEKSKLVPDAASSAVPEAPPGWTPSPAHAVAETWRPVRTTTWFSGGKGDAVAALSPPDGSTDASGDAGLLVRVVDDLGDGVPGAVVSVSHRDAKGRDIRDEFTTGAEGLVARRFDAPGRYDVMLKKAPDGWLARSAGFERENWYGQSVCVVIDAAGDKRAVELRLAIARAARLEIDVPGASAARPRDNSARRANIGIERGDGSLNEEWGGTWDGDRVSWSRLPGGSVYAFVNVDDVGSGGAWCRVEAGRTAKARIDLSTDGTSLTVRVPADAGSGKSLAVWCFQLADRIGPLVQRGKSFIPLASGRDTVVEFRNLAAGRYFVGASFAEGNTLRPAIVDLRRGENELMFPSRVDDVATVDVPVVWAQHPVRGWEWSPRPSLYVFDAQSPPGPRFAWTAAADSRDDLIHARTGANEVLVLHQPGSWYCGGANYRFLRLDVPGTTTFEPDRQ
jgi:hypothetical protein